MQSRLPDVNTAFNTHRKRAIIAIEMQNWTEALGALNAINAALPEEYRVIISDQKYQKITKQDVLATCRNCKEQVDYHGVRKHTLITSPIQILITSSGTRTIWVCPKCGSDNDPRLTEFEQTVLAQPYYLGIMSKPPTRKDDLDSHVTYDRIMEIWCWSMLGELEQKMAQYRDDNWQRGDEDLNLGMPIDTTLEDKEN